MKQSCLNAAVILTFLSVSLSGCASKKPLPDVEPIKPATPSLVQPTLPPLPAGAVRLNGIAAIVNDDIITIRDMIRESEPAISDARKKGTVSSKEMLEIRKNVLERMIEKRLTDQKVKELGIKIPNEEIRQAMDDVKRQNNNLSQQQLVEALKAQGYTLEQYEAQIREQLERMRLVSIEVRSKVHVSARDIEEYYEANKGKYAEDEMYRARHIFVKISDKASPEEIQKAMKRALDIMHEAKSGKDFGELAKQHSDDPAAKKDGGDLGTFRKGEMLADLEQALLPLQPGEVGELVSTPSGLHIVKLEEKKNRGKTKPLDTVKADIEEMLYKKKQDDRFAQWLKELRSKATIDIKDQSGMI